MAPSLLKGLKDMNISCSSQESIAICSSIALQPSRQISRLGDIVVSRSTAPSSRYLLEDTDTSSSKPSPINRFIEKGKFTTTKYALDEARNSAPYPPKPSVKSDFHPRVAKITGRDRPTKRKDAHLDQISPSNEKDRSHVLRALSCHKQVDLQVHKYSFTPISSSVANSATVTNGVATNNNGNNNVWPRFQSCNTEDESPTLIPSSKHHVPSREEDAVEKFVSPPYSEQVVMLKVSLHCKGCEAKVRKHLSRMQGVRSFNIDFPTKKVTIVGSLTPVEVLSRVSKVKNATFWTSYRRM